MFFVCNNSPRLALNPLVQVISTGRKPTHHFTRLSVATFVLVLTKTIAKKGPSFSLFGPNLGLRFNVFGAIDVCFYYFLPIIVIIALHPF